MSRHADGVAADDDPMSEQQFNEFKANALNQSESFALSVPSSVAPQNPSKWDSEVGEKPVYFDEQDDETLLKPPSISDHVFRPREARRKTIEVQKLIRAKERPPPPQEYAKPQPKLVFANERTLTQWLNNSFLISAGAAAILLHPSTNAKVVGTIMILVSVICSLYAYRQYRRRERAILAGDETFDFQSVWGPTFFAFAFITAFTLVVLMAWTFRINPTCTNLQTNFTRVDVWGGTIQQRGLEFVFRVRLRQDNDLCETATGIKDFVI